MISMFRKSVVYSMMALAPLLAPFSVLGADDFCWKDSYGRGVGTIPPGCNGGRNKEVGMCYTPCKAGYSGTVTMCLANCPPGYVNSGGLTCHYDKAIFVKGSWGGFLGLKHSCPSGYTNIGLTCALNIPPFPPGDFHGTANDPVRGSYDRGIGHAPQGCNAGSQNDAGLCYTNCKSGYSGVGPVCWAGPPSNWVQCGMGAAKDSKTCAGIVFGQVSSVATLAVNIGSLGSSTALTEGMSAPAKASKLAKLKQDYTAMKTAFELAKKTNENVKRATQAYDLANKANGVYTAVDTGMNNAGTEEDMIRMAAQIAAIMDPSGVADTVAAYTYPKCNKIFK